MKNILLLFTGGTIGSQVKQGCIDTDQSAGFKLIELFQQQYSEHVQIRFRSLQPIQILSENLHPDVWQTLIAAIEAQDLSRYDGIIITHGTDTLAFTAAALGIYFHAIKIPLLLVSSNYPLDNPQANGLANFICAVDFIRQHQAAGVFVPYQNPGQSMQVHIGTRLNSCLPLSGDFISVQNKPYLSVENGKFVTLHELPDKPPLAFKLQNQFARIMLIKPYPGLDYRHFKLDNVDAILHDLYHSGTACVIPQWGDQHSLIEFSAICQQQGIPVYLAPAIKTADAYSSTQQLLAHGVSMVWNSGLETVYAKLCLAYACYTNSNEIAAFLATNLAWEQVASIHSHNTH
ncbi:MAG: L-asparaginase [Methylomonas sp.]|nr:MAG: L-asparaginase [Methylomonas sp.]